MERAIIEACVAETGDRLRLWERIFDASQASVVMEVGIWKAEFAAYILSKCARIQTYYTIDPWRKLPGWNKPFNVADAAFSEVYREAMQAVAFAQDRVRVLRGTTLEVWTRSKIKASTLLISTAIIPCAELR
jgi:hypothetical protein